MLFIDNAITGMEAIFGIGSLRRKWEHDSKAARRAKLTRDRAKARISALVRK
jgi:hypothetical protein